MLPDLNSDPFGERTAGLTTKRMQLLGADFRFASNSVELMRLGDRAYKGLPRHRLSRLAHELRVSLLLTSDTRRPRRAEPPPLAMISGSGLLGGATLAGKFVGKSPPEPPALGVGSP